MNTFIHQSFRLLALSAVFCSLPVSATSTGGWFTLIHTNDIVSHFDETGSSECPDAEFCVGGFARLAHFVTEEKALGHKVLVVDAGNMLNTALVKRTSAETLITKLVKQVNYDVAGIGLFELFGGAEKLDKYISWLQQSGTKVVCSNLIYNISGQPATRCNKTAVVAVGDLKVGFVSYISTNIAFMLKEHNIDKHGEMKITTTEQMSAVVNDLYSKQGVDIVMCLYNQEPDLVTEMEANVPFTDVFIAAYRQGLYWNTDIKETYMPEWAQNRTDDGPMGEEIVHAYPEKVTINQREAYVVSAGRNLLYAGHIQFHVQSKKIVQFNATNPRIVWGKKDKQAENIMASVRQHQLSLMGGFVGEASDIIRGGIACIRHECAVGNLVADAMLHASIEPNRLNGSGTLIGWSKVNAALITGRSLETIFRGVITCEDLLYTYNFLDKLVVFDISGERLLDALSVSFHGNSAHNFTVPLQVSGMRFTIQSAANGTNVSEVQILCSVCAEPVLEDLDRERTYRLVTSDYLYDTFVQKRYFKDTVKVKTVSNDLKKSVEEYIQLKSPNLEAKEGRIKIIEG